MGRVIAAVVAGYATMFAFVFATFSIAYLAMGTERAFQPGSYAVTGLWLLTSFVLSFVAALVGGRVCARIGRGRKAVVGLAGLIVLLGLVLAIPALKAPDDPAAMQRSGDVANFGAMQQAKQPKWVALLTPFVGAIGVILGGKRG